MTLVSVEILELELLNVGTEKMELQFKRSGAYPLFDDVTISRFLGSSKKRAKRFKAKLVSDNPSNGFEVLANLMSNVCVDQASVSTNKVVYVDTMDESAEKLNLVRFLGAGAFSNVYKLSANRSYLKVPKTYGCVSLLQHELSTLQAFDHMGIPKAAAPAMGFLKVSVRCETSNLRCLRLEGLVGTPASTFYFGSIATLSIVCVKVLEALDHAHSRGIVHLDVSPNNIIVHHDVDGSVQAQLVDWGCALAIGSAITKFRGKRHFAHDDLLFLEKGQTLTLVGEYDLAALVYSMAEIVYMSESTSERKGSEQDSELSDDSSFERNLKRERSMFPWNLNADTDSDVFEGRRIVTEKNVAKLALDASCQLRLVKSLQRLEDVDSDMESENEVKSDDKSS